MTLDFSVNLFKIHAGYYYEYIIVRHSRRVQPWGLFAVILLYTYISILHFMK